MYMVLEERKAEWALYEERDGMTCITNQFFWALKKKKKVNDLVGCLVDCKSAISGTTC